MKISCRVRGDWFHVPCGDGNQNHIPQRGHSTTTFDPTYLANVVFGRPLIFEKAYISIFYISPLNYLSSKPLGEKMASKAKCFQRGSL